MTEDNIRANVSDELALADSALRAAERSKDLAQLEALRTSADYDTGFALGVAELTPELDRARRFVGETRDILRARGVID